LNFFEFLFKKNQILHENVVKADETATAYLSNAENTSQLIIPETEEAEKEKLEYIEREIKFFRSTHKVNNFAGNLLNLNVRLLRNT